MDRRDRLALVGAAVELGHAHAAEPDRGGLGGAEGPGGRRLLPCLARSSGDTWLTLRDDRGYELAPQAPRRGGPPAIHEGDGARAGAWGPPRARKGARKGWGRAGCRAGARATARASPRRAGGAGGVAGPPRRPAGDGYSTFAPLEAGGREGGGSHPRLAQDEQGEPYLDLTAERDFSENDDPPTLAEHELEHALTREEEREAAAASLARAEEAGQFVELVALEPGEAPDWAEAERYIDALVLDEIEDDLLELCGVDPDRDPRETWLDKVKERLRSDLERFRADVEGDHDEIEEWDFRDGRIFAAVGSFEDEADPDSGHGWMSRLLDVSALTAAGFTRVRKAQLQV